MKKGIFTSVVLACMCVQGVWAQQKLSDLVSFSPAAASSVVKEDVTYIDRRWDNNAKKVIDMEKVKKSNEYILVGTGDYSDKNFGLDDGHWYVVKGDFKADMILMPCEGNVFLILCDGAKLTCRIHFPYNWRKTSTLHIYGQKNGTGKLIADASGSKYEAGIGGIGRRIGYETGGNREGGNVIVYGGDITATGSSEAAGIGSCGDQSDIGPGTLKVYGGKITANGGYGAAGIGGAQGCEGTTITIYGGTVTGNGGRYGAGIGGGQSGNGSDITIHGGTVKGYGGVDAAGIGSGEMEYGNGNAGKLTVYGGTVEGHGNEHGAGIGGGQSGNGAEVVVYGGTVEGRGGVDAAGIGSGEKALEEHLFKSYSLNGGSLTVHGGTVKGYGGEHGAGIGGGQDASGAKVIINGGHVETDGGMDAAGIGSGEETTIGPNINGGSLTVNGGYVFADGTGWGAGIGGGEDADGATVVINGGTVIAYAGSDAGSKNGSAIGAEDGDGHRGSLKLADNLMVHAGQNPDDAKSHLFPFATRVPACFFRPYTRIEPCDHQGAKSSAFEDGISEMQCPYCCSGDGHEATGIESVETQQPTPCKHHSVWFTLDGRRLSEKPTIPGIYVNNGRKIVIK